MSVIDFTSRMHKLQNEYGTLPSSLDQLDWLMRQGLNLTKRSVERSRENRIGSCESELWFHAKVEAGFVHVAADSDSILSCGVAAIAVRLTDHLPVTDLQTIDPHFVDELFNEYPFTLKHQRSLVEMLGRVRLLTSKERRL